jgi:hypothetical protein
MLPEKNLPTETASLDRRRVPASRFSATIPAHLLGIKMAKVIHEGWSKPSDVIPRPTSIVTGRNLRAELSEREKMLKSISDYCAEPRRIEDR